MKRNQTPLAAKKSDDRSGLFDGGRGLIGEALLMLRGATRPLTAVALIVLLILLLRPGEWLGQLDVMRGWVQSRGLLGLLVVLCVYVLAAVALVPQTVLKVAAGGLFGSLWGVAVASIGSALGALACFLIARYAARGPWMNRIRRGQRMMQLNELARERGVWLVVICRLLPVFPGNLLNYALGLTQLRTAIFVFWSWLTMLPGIIVLVVGTDAILRGLAEGRVPWGMVAIVTGVLALLVFLTVVVRRRWHYQ